MARAHLPKAEMASHSWRPLVGRAVDRCIALRGWSLKEFAAAVDRDVRQCGRWITGEERVQVDAIMAVESLRQPWAQAQCELAGADVEVTVRLRRTA